MVMNNSGDDKTPEDKSNIGRIRDAIEDHFDGDSSAEPTMSRTGPALGGALGSGEFNVRDSEDYPVRDDDYSADSRSGSYNFDDPDRLPWLETADQYDEGGVSMGKLAMLVLGLLALLGLIVGGIYWIQNRNQGEGLGNGSGELIAAPEGNYKVKPENPQGTEFEGEGDVAHATADGRDPSQPMTGEKAVAPSADGVAGGMAAGAASDPANAAGNASESANVAGANSNANASIGATGAATAAGSGLVQLGAFADANSANGMWGALTSRYGYLGGYQKRVTEGQIEGRTVYRLNAVTSNPQTAAELCSKLKASGAACLIPR